jgi:hypothetical protein
MSIGKIRKSMLTLHLQWVCLSINGLATVARCRFLLTVAVVGQIAEAEAVRLSL